MAYTDTQAWMEANEMVECKPLRGRWTAKTCLEIAGKSKPKGKTRGIESLSPPRAFPCANCPILAALEKKR